MKKQKIVIVGGGPVGAMTAAFLAEQGHEIHLFERRPDLRKNDISAGRSINLALANRGITPLKQLGMMDQVNDIIIPMTGRMIHDLDGNTNHQAYGQQAHEVIYSISRGELNGLLLNKAENFKTVKTYFNHACKHVDLIQKKVNFLDEASNESVTLDYDRIIGADGAGSVIRQSILEQQKDHADFQDRIDPLDHSYKELHIPPNEKGDFQMEKQALHIWPRGGFMLIALPNMDGSFTVTLFLKSEGEISFEKLKTEQQLESFFSTYFADALALIPNLLEEFSKNPIGKLATVRCFPWVFEDSALLIGDAAHAIVPFQGQGMNCGFEDAGVLAKLTTELENWSDITTRYQELRKPNGEAIADMALENYIEMRDSVNDEVFLMKKAMGFEIEARFPELFTPKYAMIMFHEMPYAEAQSLGLRNDNILNQLIEEGSRPGSINWKLCESLLRH